MRTRQLGSLEVSTIGLGCNAFGRIDQATTTTIVDAAIDAGITFFDTAEVYGAGNFESETYLGAALDGRRSEIVLATKFGLAMNGAVGGADRDSIHRALEGSLARLRTDTVDLYQLHRPSETTPVAETLACLAELVREGVVREVGCSNFNGAQLREAEAAAADVGVRFVSVQNQLNVLQAADLTDTVAATEDLGVSYLPFFPLAVGMLTGKYQRNAPLPAGARITVSDSHQASMLTDHNFDIVEQLTAWAGDRGHTILELAFAWLLAHPTIPSVISGATAAEQVRANAAAGGWELSGDELAAVEAIRTQSN